MPSTVSEWNDRAFLLIKEGKWQDAADAATQAIKLDRNSSAGWFNLGRALLGAGKAREAEEAFYEADVLTKHANPDVRYYLGQTNEALKDFVAARSIYEDGLKQWPADKEFARALSELKAAHDTDVIYKGPADVDGDGQPDQLVPQKGQFLIVSGKTGKQLAAFTSPIDVNSGDRNPLSVMIYPLRGTTPLIQADWQCGNGPWPAIYQYDPAGTKFVVASGGDGLCQSAVYLGDGRFEFIVRSGMKLFVSTRRWENGKWVKEGNEERPMPK